MIKRPIPWRPTARTGPKQGVAVNARTVKRIIEEAENAILIAGPKIRHDKSLYETAAAIAKRNKIPIYATGGSIKTFNENGVKAQQESLLHVVNLLLDPEWKVKGKKVDTAIIIGTEYQIANNIFSTLKNWGSAKTISISPHFQPNADISLTNLNDEVFREYLEVLKG